MLTTHAFLSFKSMSYQYFNTIVLFEKQTSINSLVVNDQLHSFF